MKYIDGCLNIQEKVFVVSNEAKTASDELGCCKHLRELGFCNKQKSNCDILVLYS